MHEIEHAMSRLSCTFKKVRHFSFELFKAVLSHHGTKVELPIQSNKIKVQFYVSSKDGHNIC